MKMKTLAAALTISGVMWMPSSNAGHAIVLDGFRLDTTAAGIASVTTDIGHLNLSGGIATVIQEVNASGNPFVGAEFRELGLIFNTEYTVENAPGPNDFGPGVDLAPPLGGLQIAFTGLAGEVTAFDPATGEVRFNFTPGVGTITITATDMTTPTVFETPLAELDVGVPAGGALNNFGGPIGTLGESTILSVFVSSVPGLFLDSSGAALPLGEIGLNASTTNRISAVASTPDVCSFDPTAICREIQIRSEGVAHLLRLPEPGVPALLGLSLLAWGVIRRRLR